MILHYCTSYKILQRSNIFTNETKLDEKGSKPGVSKLGSQASVEQLIDDGRTRADSAKINSIIFVLWIADPKKT